MCPWNGTFRLHRPDLKHHAFGYCTFKQDTEEWYWGQQFGQMEKDINFTVGLTDQPDLLDRSKWAIFQGGP